MRAVAGVLGAAALMLVAGCGSSAPVAGPPALPALPAGAKPFDLFRGAELGTIQQAGLKLFNDCLAEAGYPQEREIRSAPAPVLPALLRPAINPRTEADARRQGFGTPVPRQPATIVRQDPAFNSAADKCDRAGRSALGDPDEVGGLRDRYAYLGNSLVQDRTKKTQAIMVAHSKKLPGCLAEHGYRLAAGQQFNPRGDLGQFGVGLGAPVAAVPARAARPAGLAANAVFKPEVPAREYRPSRAEVAFALAFVRCGKSSGLFAALDQAEIPMQQEIVERHGSEFSGLNPRIEALAAKAAEVLRAP
jgi:hypothetical protein